MIARAAGLACALLAAACAGSLGDAVPDGPIGDGATGCATSVTFEPTPLFAGAIVRATAHAFDVPGVLDYQWAVDFGGAPVGFTFDAQDNSVIEFPAPIAGIYHVRLAVVAAASCPTQDIDVNVAAPGGKLSDVRLHVTPPASADTPPLDKIVQVKGGAPFSVGTLSLDSGIAAAGNVRIDATAVGGYLRFEPVGMETAIEAFANPLTGAYAARLLNQKHDVLVVPASATVPPQRLPSWMPGSPLQLVAGSQVMGTVRGPGGGPLAGAKVQLLIGDVPSTVATTTATGAFTVLAVPQLGATVTVDVTPLAASGLPRLVAAAPFDVTRTIDVAYGALALRDVGGAAVRRPGGAPVVGARLTLVGTLAGVGMVSAGAPGVAATGTVRVTAVSGAGGVLPATLAPARQLAAVVEAPLNSYSVSSVDLTASVPQTIDAPLPVALATQIRAPDQTPLAGVHADLVPVGALALAGAGPLRATSTTGGVLGPMVAAGGHYELRFADPELRGAPLAVPDVTAGSVATSYALRPRLVVIGKLVRPDTQPIGAASVQILCAEPACTGVDRDRPLAEASSTASGEFAVAVPDPGTM